MSATDSSQPTLVSSNRTLMLAGVMIAMVLQTLDTTIANVALPYMGASLGATQDTVTWVLTSYVLAAAVAMPLSGWLVDRVGIRYLMIFSVLLFTLSSMLCGAAQSLNAMVLFRIMQGLAGAFLVPVAQTIILNSSTEAERPKMMSLYVQGALLGPIMGPIIGGYLTDNFNWRWVFYVNVPLGIVCLLMLIVFLPKTPKVDRKIDLVGWLLVGLMLSAVQLLLDRGITKDWFSSAEIVTYAVVAVSCLWMAAIHMSTSRNPLFSARLFADSNFVIGILFAFLTGVVVYANMALLPGLLQTIFGYPAIDAGMLMAPRGLGMFVSIILLGGKMGKLDPRIAAAFGLALTGTSVMMMTRWTVAMPAWPILLSGVMQGVGVSFVFMPLNLIAFTTLSSDLRVDASSLMSLARNMGSSFGIAGASVMLARNIQINHAELGERIGHQAIPISADQFGALHGAGGEVFQVVDGIVNQQALMLAYLNDFKAIALLCFVSAPILMLVRVKRSAAAAAAGAAPAVEAMH